MSFHSTNLNWVTHSTDKTETNKKITSLPNTYIFLKKKENKYTIKTNSVIWQVRTNQSVNKN